MVDVILIILLAAIIGGAVAYVVRAKKKGAKCIGCPYCNSCHSNESKDENCCCGDKK